MPDRQARKALDFEARTIAIRAPKNEDDRTVPMSHVVFDILQERKREWVTNRRKTKVVDARVYGESADIRQVLNRAAIRAGIEDGRRHRLQHRLRDTCATTLLDAGVALDRVQVILGHRDIGMTRKYAETRPEALRSATVQLSGRIEVERPVSWTADLPIPSLRCIHSFKLIQHELPAERTRTFFRLAH